MKLILVVTDCEEKIYHKKEREVLGNEPVFVVFETEGRVYTEIIPDAKRDTLRKVILGKVSVGSIVVTYGWRGRL